MVALKVKRLIRKTKVESCELRLGEDEILALLRTSGIDVPPTAKVTFYVPGGGDYSNETLDVDRDNPVTVSWQYVEEKTDAQD
ncbi:MAG: hypothetical protein CGW95_00950 [Phenylobacterium zucineum]|nr:MAG: hypothetical protein CGW95_00950 [Phenylobacterium zucineum]